MLFLRYFRLGCARAAEPCVHALRQGKRQRFSSPDIHAPFDFQTGPETKNAPDRTTMWTHPHTAQLSFVLPTYGSIERAGEHLSRPRRALAKRAESGWVVDSWVEGKRRGGEGRRGEAVLSAFRKAKLRRARLSLGVDC